MAASGNSASGAQASGTPESGPSGIEPAGSRRVRRGGLVSTRGPLLGLVLVAAAACGGSGPPSVTVAAGGPAAENTEAEGAGAGDPGAESVEVAPVAYCEVDLSECAELDNAATTVIAEPGAPVTITVPEEVAETPWLVSVQSTKADGTPLPVEQEFFSPGAADEYIAEPPEDDARLLVIEVQQLAAAYAADDSGAPMIDEDGAPQQMTRGIWPVEVEDGS